jgi:hypothetical protein
MVSGFLAERELSAIWDHHDSVVGLRRDLLHYQTDKYSHRKLKDERHKFENAARMLKDTETSINTVKRSECS